MAGERRVPLSNRKSKASAAAEPSRGWSFGRFLGGAISALVLCAVLFVASAYLAPPEQTSSGAEAAAPATAEEIVEAPAETEASDSSEADATPQAEGESTTPQEQAALAPVEPEPVETEAETAPELSPVPGPDTPVVTVEEEQVAIATDPAASDTPSAPPAGAKAWEVHQAAFNAPTDTPLIAILLEAPNETEIPVDAILGLGIPFTMAVVPRDDAARAFSQKARSAGFEIVAHLPMANAGETAGDSVIREGLSEQEVRVLTQDFLARVPEAIGVSNFGGSAVTPNREVMAAVIAELNRKGHAFIDIRAGVDGTGMAVARDLGTPAVRNTLILQSDTSEDEIYRLIDGAARDAGTLGEVVILAKTSAPVLLGISRWALERNGKEARLAPLTAIINRRN